MKTPGIDIIALGGSAGSLPLIIKIISLLPQTFPFAIVIILHRQRNVNSELTTLLTAYGNSIKIIEPDDKEPVKKSTIYLAPQNYHLLVEDNHFSLDYSEPVMFSRPSIDVAFESIALTYDKRVTAILLSGANHDGAAGIKIIADKGGIAIVQNPDTAEYAVMPDAALSLHPGALIYTPDEIIGYIQQLINCYE